MQTRQDPHQNQYLLLLVCGGGGRGWGWKRGTQKLVILMIFFPRNIKCLILFSGKIKKNISKRCLLFFSPGTVIKSVKFHAGTFLIFLTSSYLMISIHLQGSSYLFICNSKKIRIQLIVSMSLSYRILLVISKGLYWSSDTGT